MHIKVQQHEYPFLPLLWFHVAAVKKEDVIQSLLQDFSDISGTAFFEMHLVDALVAVDEPMEQVSKFAEERIAFAHRNMPMYQPLV